MIRLFIVDDHVFIREGLKKILGDEADFIVAGEASNSTEAIEKLRGTECDIVLLDINLPGRNGMELLEEIKRLYPELHILILSMHPEEHYAIRALRAGASGYITKDSYELANAIRTVFLRGKYITPAVAQLLADNLESSFSEHPHDSLSTRELEVMFMIASGKTIREIADELSLSVSSVNTYRTRILEKMNMKSNVELTFYAIKHKLIE